MAAFGAPLSRRGTIGTEVSRKLIVLVLHAHIRVSRIHGLLLLLQVAAVWQEYLGKCAVCKRKIRSPSHKPCLSS